jgi:hypothetical protein
MKYNFFKFFFFTLSLFETTGNLSCSDSFLVFSPLSRFGYYVEGKYVLNGTISTTSKVFKISGKNEIGNTMTLYTYLSTLALENNTHFFGDGKIIAYGLGFWLMIHYYIIFFYFLFIFFILKG